MDEDDSLKADEAICNIIASLTDILFGLSSISEDNGAYANTAGGLKNNSIIVHIFNCCYYRRGRIA